MGSSSSPSSEPSRGRLAGASEQTCALLEMAPAELRFHAFTLEGREIKTLAFPRGSKNKVSVT